MALRVLSVLLMFFLVTNAAPMHVGQPTNNESTSPWTNEAIFGLVSVFVAVLGISITLVASPKMRRNIKSAPLLPLSPYGTRFIC
jgi:hypothetical protein